MTFNLNTMILQEIKNDLDTLLETVTGGKEEQYRCTADQMERHLFRQLLVLGGKMLQLFFDARSAQYPRQKAVRPDGVELPYHSEKSRDYYSLFGPLVIKRPYFYQKGEGGYHPLDKELGLGKDCYSDSLHELHDELGVEVSFERTVRFIERWLEVGLSTRCVKQFISQDGVDVADYYEQKPPPEIAEEGRIMVVQADGKGVPIIKSSDNKDSVRLHRGQARSRKKAVTATSLYTIDPAVRTVDEIMASLLQEGEQGVDLNRSGPCHKQIWGTLAGKAAALTQLRQQAEKRKGPHIQHGVMLCDGDRYLQAALKEHFDDFTLILDFIHAYEYLWQVASALFNQDAPERLPWVRHYTRSLLSGQALTVAKTFRALAQESGRRSAQVKILNKVARYFETNHPYMAYDTYLARGWPIASGVIEGVCRHFVKDRLELSGMRWSIAGAEQLLQLRAVAENGDWADYHRFRQQQRQQRLYHADWPEDIPLPTLSSVHKSAYQNHGPSDPIPTRPVLHELPLAR